MAIMLMFCVLNTQVSLDNSLHHYIKTINTTGTHILHTFNNKFNNNIIATQTYKKENNQTSKQQKQTAQ